MDLSVALIIAASFAILCTFYIGKRILTIDFSEYSSKNSKKAKLERLLAKKETPLQNSKIRRDMRNAFERILIPLGNADQDLLPARMDMAFRKKIVSQINRLNRNKLCRKIYGISHAEPCCLRLTQNAPVCCTLKPIPAILCRHRSMFQSYF